MRARAPVPEAWAELDEAGERERDDTCAPEGTEGHWEVTPRSEATPSNRAAMDYQRQISRTLDLGRLGVIEYRVTDPARGVSVLFDGCAFWSPEHELLEAKNGYGSLFAAAEKSGRWGHCCTNTCKWLILLVITDLER